MDEIENQSSEYTVREYLQNKGWTVSNHHINQNGFDLLAVRDGKFIVIEVKEALLVNDKYWRVRTITEKAKQSDIIAIVMPNKYIHFDSMTHHLNCINSDGDRYITDMVNMYL
jgi:hypothetical protein